MGIFKRKPKENFLSNVNVELFEKDYKSLSEALLGELSTGSHDTKETIISFADREIIVRSSSGIIKSVSDSSDNLPLAERLYWSELTVLSDEMLEEIKSSTTADLILKYSDLVNNNPESRELFKSVFRAYSIMTLKKVSADFSQNTKIRTEILPRKSEVTYTEGLDYLDFTPSDVDSRIELENSLEIVYLSAINSQKHPFEKLVLSTGVETIDRSEDSYKFVYTAAESGATLAEVKSLSSGFVWSEILEVLKDLMEDEIVFVTIPSLEKPVVAEAPLPSLIEETDDEDGDLSIEIEDANESAEETVADLIDHSEIATATDLEPFNVGVETLPLEGVIVEFIDDEDHHSFDAHDDDGSFMYETLDDDNQGVSTDGVHDQIEDDIRSVVRNSTVDESVKDEIVLYLRQNSTLEAELMSIEKTIADKSEHYYENVEFFENMKFNRSLAALADDSEVGHESNLTNGIVSQTQDSSHKSFFVVSKLEEDRHVVNIERKKILTKLATLLSDMTDEGIQSILHRIEIKIAGIENVINLAFHNPKEDENEIVDPSLLEDNADIETLTPEEHRVISKHESPTFFSLVEELGFNPFETTF
jgi:hypothetical protein